jgi:hypothetical protein
MSFRARFVRQAALGAALSVLVGPSVVLAGPDEWAARVDRIEGAFSQQDAMIEHQNASEPARPYVHLYRGDRVDVRRPGVRVYLSMPGGDTRSVDVSNSPFVVSGTGQSPMLGQSVEYLAQGLGNWLSGGGVAVPHSTYTRGATTSVPPAEDDVEPSGVQYLPENYTSAAFIWRGQGGVLQIQQEGGSPYTHESHVTSILVSIPSSGDVNAQLQGANFSWQLRRAPESSVPSPPWYPAGFKPTSNQERVVRAMWLLQSGPKEWRAFALSELAVLSTTEEDANEAWSAIRTGDAPDAD